jgi:hypothetical protein
VRRFTLIMLLTLFALLVVAAVLAGRLGVSRDRLPATNPSATATVTRSLAPSP